MLGIWGSGDLAWDLRIWDPMPPTSTTSNDADTMNFWEQMVTEERKRRAKVLGVRVCDLEDEETLQATMAASAADDAVVAMDDANALIDETKAGSELDEELYVEDVVEGSKISLPQASATCEPVPVAPAKGKQPEGGPWIRLPNELTDRILMYVGDPDMCGYLLMASKSVFQPREHIYRYLCEAIYPRQTVKKTAHLEKWTSWKHMLVQRHRLRTNGLYSLRTMFTKPHCNDAFWEEKNHESIEVRYHRHFRFFEHGRVLYSLDITEPRDMVRLLQARMPVSKRIYEGTYTLARNHLTVEVGLISFSVLCC